MNRLSIILLLVASLNVAHAQDTIVPNLLVTNNNWLLNTGSSYPDLVDEGPPGDGNATIIYSFPNGGSNNIEMHLTDVSDPNSSATHTLSAQVGTSNPGGELTVGLYDGATLITTWVYSPPSNTGFYEVTHDLTTAEADNISNYNDLRVDLSGNQNFVIVSQVCLIVPAPSGGGGGSVRYKHHVMGVDSANIKSVLSVPSDTISQIIGR